MKIHLIAGARPNFMKIAPIVGALDRNGRAIDRKIVHTGQHYDFEMSQSFFEELEIPKPDFFLGAGSGSHAEQTAKIMLEFEKVCLEEKPELIIVVGDVNSTLACSVVAKKLLIRVAHVEAGLRSFDLTMPEEINRMVTDAISDYFFVTEKSAVDNLLKEGKPEDRIFFVGHVMVDNLLYHLAKLNGAGQADFKTSRLKNDLKKYAFLTLHRPANVDHRETFGEIVEALNQIAEELSIVFSVHPRTRKMIEKFDLKLSDRIFLLPPLGFKESLYLWKDACLVMTDSGGLQEETTALRIPCFTLRNNTERPITITEGTNILAGTSKKEILHAFFCFQKGYRKTGKIPELWDGHAADRIVEKLLSFV